MAKAWPVPAIDPNASLAENSRQILRVRTAEYFSYAPIVDDERQTTALHNLRISAKRLRYTLELFRSVFGEKGEAEIERVKSIQELLGQLHDHDVRIALIEDELAILAVEQTVALGRTLAESPTSAHESIATAALRPPPDDPRRGLLALLGRQYTSRHETYLDFYDHWQRFAADGLRSHLVELSATPLSSVPASNSLHA
jgi:hypothetical protein